MVLPQELEALTGALTRWHIAAQLSKGDLWPGGVIAQFFNDEAIGKVPYNPICFMCLPINLLRDLHLQKVFFNLTLTSHRNRFKLKTEETKAQRH